MTRAYFEAKNRVKSIATTAGLTTVQDLSYNYDNRLNPTRRTDVRQGKHEYFEHDGLDRLTKAYFQPASGRPAVFTYDPNGNLTSRPGIKNYLYDPDHPHAVRDADGAIYGYDAVGNQTSRPGGTIAYTAFDLPKLFTLDGQGGTITLEYDGHQQRIRKVTAAAETLYAGDLYERVTPKNGGDVEHHYYVYSSERLIATVKRSGPDSKTLYVHADALGSVDALTNSAGAVDERRSYDAFGARRNPHWGAPLPSSFSSETSRGFTGHEGDAELGLVNMKGRLYDPALARFLTPDPLVAKPHFSQSWNAYSYVLNSPLAYVDPSGFTEDDLSSTSFELEPGALPPPPGAPPITVWVFGTPREPKPDTSGVTMEAGASHVPHRCGDLGELGRLRARAVTG